MSPVDGSDPGKVVRSLCGLSRAEVEERTQVRTTVILCMEKVRELNEGFPLKRVAEALGEGGEEEERLNAKVAFQNYYGAGRDTWSHILRFLI